MTDERNENQEQELNEENDAREEDTVEDTDADTRNVEENEDRNDAHIEERFSGLESILERILGEISSLREAQGIMVENGAVINDTATDFAVPEEDEFIAPKEMDLLI